MVMNSLLVWIKTPLKVSQQGQRLLYWMWDQRLKSRLTVGSDVLCLVGSAQTGGCSLWFGALSFCAVANDLIWNQDVGTTCHPLERVPEDKTAPHLDALRHRLREHNVWCLNCLISPVSRLWPWKTQWTIFGSEPQWTVEFFFFFFWGGGSCDPRSARCPKIGDVTKVRVASFSFSVTHGATKNPLDLWQMVITMAL